MADDQYDRTLAGALQAFKEHLINNLDNCLPCEVLSVGDDRQTVTVRPSIKVVDKDGNLTSRADIESVPVLALGSGSICMSVPVSVGSKGWIHACDRDISVYLQSFEETNPGTRRKHSFSDARFIPDMMTGYSIASEDDTALVIQNLDGDVKVAVDTSEVRVKTSGASVTVNGDSVTVTASGSLTGTASNGATINSVSIDSSGNVVSPASITAGTTMAAGTAVSAPSIAAASNLTVAGVAASDSNHYHTVEIDGTTYTTSAAIAG